MVSEKKRIYQLAKDYKISSNAMLSILQELKFQPKSHMSIATTPMVEAIKKKFAQSKQEAKQEMQQRAKVREAVEKTSSTQIGGIKVDNAKSSVAGIMRKIEKKQKRKDRRKRKNLHTVDSTEVAKTFKSTMADLQTTKQKKKYRKDGDTESREVYNPNLLEVTEFISLAELAKLMDKRPAELISKLFEMGMMATINQRLDIDTIGMLTSEFGFEITQMAEVGDTAREIEVTDHLETRAPIVTIMGHVDHGKTSVLDYIRKTNVVAGEAGAITQHIGAYEVEREDGRITFLDTPGHEAFTAMRARGTQITDIIVLVVAADDGVQPQTVEAIDHARAASVPIIVAINKIDKPNANPEKIRTQLANHNILSEAWGGKTIMVEISAKTGDGIDELLKMILLQAEMMDLQADPGIRGQGVIIDSKLEKGRGPVITVLIQRGRCFVGNSIVAGMYYGHVRTITNDRDKQVKRIGPSRPAQITGLNGVPQAGDSFIVVENDQEAKEISIRRSQVKKAQEARRTHGGLVTLDKVFDRIKEGKIKELRLIIKGDVDGSVEVLSDTLGKIATDEVKTNIIHQSVGAIRETDVLLAAASDAIIIGFQVTPDVRAREIAKNEKVDIREYSIIYEAENDVRKALEGLLEPEIKEVFVGSAEVRNIFKVQKFGTIAGCYVKEGRVKRKDKCRLVRDGKIIYTGMLNSLKRFKDDAKEVKEGFECGIGIENYNDIKVNDVIEMIEFVEEARTLDKVE